MTANESIEKLIGTSQTIQQAFLRLRGIKLDISGLEKGFEIMDGRKEFAIILSDPDNSRITMLHPYGTNMAYYVI